MSIPDVTGVVTRSGTGTLAPPSGEEWLALVMGSAVTTPAANFTLVDSWSVSGPGTIYRLFRCTGSPGSTWTVSAESAVLVLGLDRALKSAPAVTTNTGTTSPTATASEECLVLRAVMDQHGSATNVSYPSGAPNDRTQARTDAGGGYYSVAAVATSDRGTSGSVGTASWTVPSSWEPRAFTILLYGDDPTPPPDTPTGLTVDAGTRGVLDIEHAGSAGATSYVYRWRRTDLTPPSPTTQTSAPWHLDRIDQSGLPLSGTYTYTYDGTGVIVYVVDSGVRFSHDEFTSQTPAGANYGGTGTYATDEYNHGTGVASMVAGATGGVAKGAELVSVKGNDTQSFAVEGACLQWIIDNHPEDTPGVVTIATWTLDDPGSPNGIAYSALWDELMDMGLVCVACAANDNGIPAYVPMTNSRVLTVGATNDSDARYSQSNYGSLVRIYAPGEDVSVASATGDSAFIVQDGTSIAAPQVAGTAAKIKQGNPRLSHDRVVEVLLSQARQNIISSIPSGPNRLLNSNANTTEWTVGTIGLTLEFDGLDDEATYEIQVAAIGPGGQSAWSSGVSEETIAGGGTPLPLAVGANTVDDVRVGSTQIDALYLGSTQVWTR